MSFSAHAQVATGHQRSLPAETVRRKTTPTTYCIAAIPSCFRCMISDFNSRRTEQINAKRMAVTVKIPTYATTVTPQPRVQQKHATNATSSAVHRQSSHQETLHFSESPADLVMNTAITASRIPKAAIASAANVSASCGIRTTIT
jgi:hypothetical protein